MGNSRPQSPINPVPSASERPEKCSNVDPSKETQARDPQLDPYKEPQTAPAALPAKSTTAGCDCTLSGETTPYFQCSTSGPGFCVCFPSSYSPLPPQQMSCGTGTRCQSNGKYINCV